MSESQTTADDFIGDDGANWRDLGRTLAVSLWFRVAVAISGLVELVFGLLSSVYETVYGALATLLGLPFNGWADILAAAWRAAGQSLAGSYGLVAWVVAIVVVAAFFWLLARALRTLIEGVTP